MLEFNSLDDPPKASPDQTTEIEVDPKTSDSDFTERITEV